MLCTPAHRHRNRRILRRGLMLVGAAIVAVLLPAPVSAQTGVDTPAGIVRALYAAHARDVASSEPGLMEKPAIAGRYFSVPVARALAAKDIGFDPLFNGQDAKITGLKIETHPKPASTRGVARVRVTFRNFGKADRLTFVLFRTRADTWRINDIVHKDWRLRKLLGMK